MFGGVECQLGFVSGFAHVSFPSVWFLVKRRARTEALERTPVLTLQRKEGEAHREPISCPLPSEPISESRACYFRVRLFLAAFVATPFWADSF